MICSQLYLAIFYKNYVVYRRLKEVQRGLRLCSVLRLLPVCAYLGVAALQRDHLFVWSVFAPKLLYEAFALLVSVIILIPCYVCLTVVKTV